MPYSLSLPGIELAHLALDLIQLHEELQRLLADGALVVDPQLVELAPGVRQATGLGYAHLEAGLIATEVVAHQLAVPAVLAGQPDRGLRP